MNRWLIIGFFTLVAAGSFAQESGFRIEVSADTLLAGNYFELKYTVEDMAARFEAPDLSGFDIVGGPNTSSSFSMINGKVTQSSSYSYYLKPADIGVYTIPPAYVMTDSDTLATMPIDIIVVPNPEGIIQQPNRPSQRYEDFFYDFGKQPSEKPVKPNVKSKRKKKIF